MKILTKTEFRLLKLCLDLMKTISILEEKNPIIANNINEEMFDAWRDNVGPVSPENMLLDILDVPQETECPFADETERMENCQLRENEACKDCFCRDSFTDLVFDYTDGGLSFGDFLKKVQVTKQDQGGGQGKKGGE